MLPPALRSILSKEVRFAILKLAICSKVIDPIRLNSMQLKLVKTLCMIQKFIPPSYFEIIIHLTVHSWYVKNYNRPEGSIVETYVAEESVGFCSEYLTKADAVGFPKYTSFESKALSTSNLL